MTCLDEQSNARDKQMPVEWKKAFYGWYAFANGQRLAVNRYRRGDGSGFLYVARVNSSARTSPAAAHPTAAAAKRDAEAMLLTTHKE